MKAEHPDAELIAHPECEEPVLALADFVGSTPALLDHVRKSPKRSFVVATEMGILHSMAKARPDAQLIGAPPDSGCQCATCPYMRLNTLEKLTLALRDLEPEVTVPEDVRRRALVPIERMLALG
jgi:quinolinate synthase